MVQTPRLFSESLSYHRNCAECIVCVPLKKNRSSRVTRRREISKRGHRVRCLSSVCAGRAQNAGVSRHTEKSVVIILTSVVLVSHKQTKAATVNGDFSGFNTLLVCCGAAKTTALIMNQPYFSL